MRFIDTHCHLYDEAFDSDRNEALQRALDAGVDTLLLPDIDSLSTAALDKLYSEFPQHFRRMTGLHPTSVKEDYEQELALVHARLFDSGIPFIAVGEIGLDFYWDRTFEEQQLDALRRQLGWAAECNLPVALHVRKAHNELFNLLRDINCPTWRGVMHCFGGSLPEAYRAMELGFHLGIGGVVTFKNAALADIVREVPLERLLLETDAPYLAPVPYRGKRNESAYIPVIAQKIADIKGISLEEVATVTTDSATALFHLHQEATQ